MQTVADKVGRFGLWLMAAFAVAAWLWAMWQLWGWFIRFHAVGA